MTTGRGFSRGRVSSRSVTDQRARRTLEQLARGDDLGAGLQQNPATRRLEVKPALRVSEPPEGASSEELRTAFCLLLTRLREAGFME